MIDVPPRPLRSKKGLVLGIASEHSTACMYRTRRSSRRQCFVRRGEPGAGLISRFAPNVQKPAADVPMGLIGELTLSPQSQSGDAVPDIHPVLIQINAVTKHAYNRVSSLQEKHTCQSL
jgi:hypothetical protein